MLGRNEERAGLAGMKTTMYRDVLVIMYLEISEDV